MSGYGNFDFNKKRRTKKRIITAVIIAAAAVLAVVFCIGIINGGTNDEASLVSENTQLKIQLGEKDAQIQRLEEEVENLTAQLEARPTPSPTPLVAQTPSPSPKASISPRDGIR